MIKAAVYGRLGADPVERKTRNGKDMATASLAVNVARYDEDEDTLWVSVAAFGKSADVLLRHVKGDLVAVMGQLTRRRYADRNGEEKEGWSLTVDAIVSARPLRAPCAQGAADDAQSRNNRAGIPTLATRVPSTIRSASDHGRARVDQGVCRRLVGFLRPAARA